MDQYITTISGKTYWIQKARCLALSENGASFAEYGLLITLIAIACYLGVSTFGGAVSQLFADPRIDTFLSGN
jgi:Flp pilus assembly pilin Flp